MDQLKEEIVKHVVDSVKRLEDYASFEDHTLEVQDVTPTELMIRAQPNRRMPGAPRYFRVKISEAQ